jgi:hypothetical protein
MNDTFTYLIENLSLYSPSSLEVVIGLMVSVVIIIGMRYIFLYGYGYTVVVHDAKELRKKRDTLSDLILMKDIQTELEKEIEQAMLKATFQG